MRPHARRHRRGSSLVEFSLTFAFAFVPVFFGLIEYSWFFFQQSQVENASREALRSAVGVMLEDDPAASLEELVAEELAAAGVRGEASAVTSITGESPQQVLNLELKVEFMPLTGLVPVPEAHHGAWSSRLEDQDT